MATDNTNETEQLKSGPISPEEITEWENALSREDKIQLRRLQLQQASISRATPDKDLTDAEWGRLTDAEWGRLTDAEFLNERMKRYGF